jgi:hypothetical protein
MFAKFCLPVINLKSNFPAYQTTRYTQNPFFAVMNPKTIEERQTSMGGYDRATCILVDIILPLEDSRLLMPSPHFPKRIPGGSNV